MPKSKSNPAIIYNGEDNNAYCGACDYLLYEKRDGSMICSNPDCGRIYSSSDVLKHKSKLGPDIKRYEDGPELVMISGYTDMKRKAPTPGEIEHLAMV
jgi:hypothetical protein